MKILILGSKGFIGSNLVTFFMENGHEVSGCDLTEYADAEYSYQKISILSSDFPEIFSRQQIDVCINASGSGNVAYSIAHPLDDFEANTIAVTNVLDSIRKCQPSCKFIHISSAAVYGNPKKLPIKETDDISPLSPYGFHKWMSELVCREYQQLYQLPVAIVRPFSVYGNGLKKQLLWDICTRLEKADTARLFGTGDESRDFLHVTDLARLIETVSTKSGFMGDVYNAASGEETTIRQVAGIFESKFPPGKKILFSGEIKKGDPLNWKADISRIGDLGFIPEKKLEPSVIGYIDWYNTLSANNK